MISDSVNQSPNTLPNLEYPWHQATWQHFIAARLENHLPHAILLSGEEGIAKLDLAKRMAKSLLCMNSNSAVEEACNSCQSCKTYESGANPDFTHITLLDDKQQIGVDQVRSLSNFLNVTRSYNTHRVVIINPAERMNLNAANSLLKSLEEPSDNTVIILVTAGLNRLLPTIKSRCQLFTVTTPSENESIDWLQLQQNQQIQLAQNQETHIEPKLLLDMIGNKPLIALTLNQEDITNRKNFFEDLNAAMKEQITITEIAKKWEKHDLETLLDWQTRYLQKAIKTAFCSMTSTAEPTITANKLTSHLTIDDHWALYQNLIKQKQYIHTSVNSLMFMENMIMLWLKAS